jgi:sugar phosphate isomerase/epimerase
MASYYARVELHDATWPDDYEDLHKALAKHGFKNCAIFGETNKRLPTGFYHATGRTDDHVKVTNAVCDAAKATGFEYEVVVVKSLVARAKLSKKC